MARALSIFTVRHGAYRVRVRLLPTMRDVDAEFREGRRPRRIGWHVPAFFQPMESASAKHVGTIVLPADGPLRELVPHEVTHAAMHRIGSAERSDDEQLATAVGLLTARIFSKLQRFGLEV